MDNETIIDELINVYQIILSIVTIEELDNLKTNKDSETSFKARKAIRKINDFSNLIVFDLKRDIDKGICFGENKFNTNDDIIVSCAKRHKAYIMSEDFNLKIKAKAINVQVVEQIKENSKYTGFSEHVLDENSLANFYQCLTDNIFNCSINEYIIIKNESEEIVDIRKWTGDKYIEIYNKKIDTSFFGNKIKPKDSYQHMVVDSIMNNTMTAISGKAGTGKSFLALVCAMKLIESGKYDRLTILFNPTKTRGASDMGFYTGSQVEKALQNSIGQMLISKFVDESTVTQLIRNGKIKLVSMADARGMEISNTDILYITESQNTSVDLMKLCLSRASENCKVVIEGDYTSQVDSCSFENSNNGMIRVIDKLKGNEIFGYVELQNVYRSKIAMLVDSL